MSMHFVISFTVVCYVIAVCLLGFRMIIVEKEFQGRAIGYLTVAMSIMLFVFSSNAISRLQGAEKFLP